MSGIAAPASAARGNRPAPEREAGPVAAPGRCPLMPVLVVGDDAADCPAASTVIGVSGSGFVARDQVAAVGAAARAVAP